MTYDVVVAGAGPVGLFLAAEVRLAGASVLVLERDEDPARPAKAGSMGARGLNTPTVAALHLRGLLPAVRASSLFWFPADEPPPEPGSEGEPALFTPAFIGHFAGIDLRADRLDPTDPEIVPDPLGGGVIAQQDLEDILAAHATGLGVEIRRGVAVTGLEEGVVRTSEGPLAAGWLVGCDGGRSTVRKFAGFGFPGVDPVFTGRQAIVEMTGAEGLVRGDWQRGEAGSYVVGGWGTEEAPRIHTVEFVPPEDGRAEVTAEELQASLRRVSGVDVTITKVHAATRYADTTRQADTYRRGRVLLAGDAAHVHSPAGGQGLNLGIGDALNLGWKLAAVARGQAPESLLDTYTAERHPIGAWVQNWTLAQTAVSRPDDPRAEALRAVLTELLDTPRRHDVRSQEDRRCLAALRPAGRVPADRPARARPAADRRHHGRRARAQRAGDPARRSRWSGRAGRGEMGRPDRGRRGPGGPVRRNAVGRVRPPGRLRRVGGRGGVRSGRSRTGAGDLARPVKAAFGEEQGKAECSPGGRGHRSAQHREPARARGRLGRVRVAVLTREYPPTTYGGAGTYVEFLVNELRKTTTVDVHCFGEPREGAIAHGTSRNPDRAMRSLATGIEMAASIDDVDLVHSHTWHTGLAGHLASLREAVPHVVTVHSLEPDRPWKVRQLGKGYRVSAWSERTALTHAGAIAAVSEYMRTRLLTLLPELDERRLHVVYGGVDSHVWRPSEDSPAEPYVLAVARMSQQKGIGHFLEAARLLPPEVQVVVVTSPSDDVTTTAEVTTAIEELAAVRPGVTWIKGPLQREALVKLMHQAALFCCPSVYEPLGLLNLEAMSCAVPVVAGHVGGIPEVVVDGETGLLVPFDADDHAAFARDLAEAMRTLLDEPGLAAKYGHAGRERAIHSFSWARTAEATSAVYRSV